MDVGAVGAFCVERLDHAGADDRHRRRHRGQVAVGLLLPHLADSNPSARHQRPLGDGATGRGDDPWEVLKGADLESHAQLVAEGHGIGAVAQDGAPVVGDAHEGAAIALLRQPLEIGEVLRVRRPNPIKKHGECARFACSTVDLLGSPVAGDDGQEVVHDPRRGIEQERIQRS